jgi:arabinogalactan oligomer/maltooligosaccharide transport system permease protein
MRLRHRSRLDHGLVAALMLLTAIPGLLLCGCGGKKSGGEKSAGPVEIVIWEQRDPQEKAVMEAVLAEYQAAHPGLTVSLVHYDTENLRSQYQTAALAGGGPDLVYGPSDQVGPFSILQIIRPLDEFLPGTTWARFLPAALDTLDGHVWALPDQVGNHLNLLYNTELVATPPETFAELVQVAQAAMKRSSGRVDVYGLAFEFNEPFWLVPFLSAYGGWVMDADRRPTLDTPATVKALTFLRELRDTYEVMPRECDYQLMDTLFKGGKVAMIVNGPWSFRDYQQAGVPFKLARIPRAEPGGPWAAPMIGSKGYSVNVNLPAAKEAAVKDLLDYLTSADISARYGVELGILPSIQAAYDRPEIRGNETLLASLEQWKVGRRMPVVPEMRVIWDAMRPNMQAVMNGSKTPEAAARDMQADAVEKIESMKR